MADSSSAPRRGRHFKGNGTAQQGTGAQAGGVDALSGAQANGWNADAQSVGTAGGWTAGDQVDDWAPAGRTARGGHQGGAPDTWPGGEEAGDTTPAWAADGQQHDGASEADAANGLDAVPSPLDHKDYDPYEPSYLFLEQANGDSGRRHRHHHHHHHHGRGKRIAAVVGCVLLALVVVGGVTGFTLYRDATSILAQSKELMAQAATIKDDLQSGNGEQLLATSQSIASQVADMRKTTDGINWTIGGLVPVVGSDVRAARGLVEQADNLTQNALLPAAQSLSATGGLSGLMQDGTINVEALQQLTATLQQVQPAVEQSAQAIDNLPQTHVGKLTDAINKLRDPLDKGAAALRSLDDIAPVLPQMLGANGQTRTYLLMAENNAELRSTGGFPGSAGLMTVTDGKIEMGEFSSPAIAVPWYDECGFGVTDEEKAIFGDRVGRIICDTNYIPDFPRAASLFSQMWLDKLGGAIDGVIAVDPVLLQYLLGLTGGVEANGITVDGSNAARMLESEAYAQLSTEDQDAFFSAVAGEAFSSLMDNLGNVGLLNLTDMLGRGIEEGRFIAWMPNEDEENALQAMGCTGEVKTDPATPQLGVYAGDDTASKMSWYLSTGTNVSEGVTNADGTVTYHVTSTFKNNLDADTAAGLTEYVTGNMGIKRDITDMFIHVYLFAPAVGSISNLAADGGDLSIQPFTEMPYNGMQVFTASPRILGGETMTVSYDVTCAAGSAPLSVRTTPTAQEAAGWTA